ncbi:3-dehydroquinate synthase [Denitrobaculum tricleocarpae]|uniref:3-dehydroquinate synthase n=1 Tax=Denitrobaculum tricleocarpae TaxID=2591009 RepID=A0A545T7U1_9PROT|nr:3-dehydroquinate synthase [Denitrobaculum tricleocarpae]TQV73287.1 3-dehydroquinate synthase [Denitrobaculum tricleocarpae]
MTTIDTLEVSLGDRAYDIKIGSGLIAQAGGLIKPVLRQPSAVVVTDENLAAQHLPALEASLTDAGIAHRSLVLPAGEATKSFAKLEEVIDRLLEGGIERGTTLVALGGGVIGDLTGFAAAVTLRGLDFIQIPTTLLAQVDSSVGGKTGINTARGKNLVGSFHQPRLVLADMDVLETLPQREFLAGYAEVVKYGLINDPVFFTWLEEKGPALIAGDRDLRREAVLVSCRAKADIVAQDEREAGLRALLNLGHTFGHAFEAEAGYGGGLIHGEAVALGMVMAFDLSVEMGFCPPDDAARVRAHLQACGLPVALTAIGGNARTGAGWNSATLVSHMMRDKKVSEGRITFVLARGIGKAFLERDVELERVDALLKTSLAA